MSSDHTLPVNELTPRSIIEELRCHGWTVKTGSAAFGFCGGVFTGVAGCLLTVLAWFTGAVWHGYSVQRSGTILLFLTITLFTFGAHCLDLLEKEHERKKR